MDNPTKWNITNSAQNIVSALVDPSKQFDSVFKREWSNSFSAFPKQKLSVKIKAESELRDRLKDYTKKLETRKIIKKDGARRNEGTLQPQSRTESDRSQVPEIFLRDDFDLSNLETFLEVMSLGKNSDEHSKKDCNDTCDLTNFDSAISRFNEVYQDGNEDHKLTKNELTQLQQKLTDYLDIIEEQLASQISNRSGDFFQVMSSVDSVMDELSLAIKSVTSLRKKCAHFNTSIIVPNTEFIKLNDRRDNAQSVLNKMNEIAHLCKVQPTIQILLSASDFVGALDLIAKSRITLHKDLTRVICLRHLESQLNEIERMIGTMMQQEFLTLISSEWDGSLSNQQTSAATRLSKLFDYFANGYSEIPERGSLTLLSLLQIQAEKFVNQFHEERKKRVESALDIEQWKVVEVPQDFQRLITMIVDERLAISDIFSGENMNQLALSRNSSATSSIAAMDSTMNGLTDNEIDLVLKNVLTTINDKSKGVSATSSKNGNTGKSLSASNYKQGSNSLNCVEAAGSSYVIVNCVINLVRTVMDYCKCAHDIRSLSTDLLERLFKILLLYNSKTYHLVYSAGAVQVAGLKSITTRSLVVSQRSLKLIVLLIPSIKRHFDCLLPEKDNRLKRFNEIISIYEEHAAKIPERIKSLVKDVMNLQLLDWEAKPPVPSQHFTSCSQYLVRLHENIHDAMPATELELLFRELSETFKTVLIDHLRRLEIKADAGPQQWLVTQELTFYRITLSKLKAFANIDLNFDDLWLRLSQIVDKEKNETPDGGQQRLQNSEEKV